MNIVLSFLLIVTVTCLASYAIVFAMMGWVWLSDYIKSLFHKDFK